MRGAIDPGTAYTLKEARDLLALSESTFRLLLARGEIKGHKVGRLWRFLGSDLLKLLKDKTTPSTQGSS